MTHLLVIRHGQSSWNAAGRWQGWGDPPLSPAGRDQARAAAAALHGFAGPVYSSDLRRARETAEVIAEHAELGAVVVDEGLREIDVGEWSGLTSTQIEERWPGALDEWRALRLDRPPGGERRDDLLARALRAVARVAARHAGERALVVSHGGTIHALERHAGAFEAQSLSNLGGRWFDVGPATGEVRAIERVALVG